MASPTDKQTVDPTVADLAVSWVVTTAAWMETKTVGPTVADWAGTTGEQTAGAMAGTMAQQTGDQTGNTTVVD